MIRLYVESNGGSAVFNYLDRFQSEVVDGTDNELPIDAAAANTHVLPNELRILFVNCLADYTVSLFGSRPSDERLKNIAHSAVALVPSLASKCSENEIVITNEIHNSNVS